MDVKTAIAISALAIAAPTAGLAAILYRRKPDYGSRLRLLEYDTKVLGDVPLTLIKQKMKSITRITCKERIKIIDTPTELNMYVAGICDAKTAVLTANVGMSDKDHKGWCAFALTIYKENKILFEEAIQKNKKIYIIGTSMGAAVTAYIVSFLLDLYDQLKKPRNVMGICTSSPRCLTMARNEKVHDYVFSIVNMLDLVTYLPLGRLVLPGRIIAVVEDDNDISFKLYESHTAYIAATKTFMKKMNIPVVSKYHSLRDLHIALATDSKDSASKIEFIKDKNGIVNLKILLQDSF
jgi:hypothetical protein